jgi:hypothetical protein
MPRVVLLSIVFSLILSTALLSTQARAVDFTSLECAAVPFNPASVYDAQVPCTAVIRRGGSGDVVQRSGSGVHLILSKYRQ